VKALVLARHLCIAVCTAIIIGASLFVFCVINQRSMLYFPSRSDAVKLGTEAARAGLEAWRDDAGNIIGWKTLSAPDDPRPQADILFLHGNAGYAVHRAAYIPILRNAAKDRAISIHILEYPGYGARPGKPSQQGHIAAALEALRALRRSSRTIVVGESIGTGVACALASEASERVAGLVLLTPFDSLVAVAKHHYPLLPVGWLLRDRYPSADWLRRYHGPMVVILAGRDQVVPMETGRRLYESYSGPKLLLTAPHADHNEVIAQLPEIDWSAAMNFALGPEA
jgi:pimeloyl-ACP methyl ester carboxylesterase